MTALEELGDLDDVIGNEKARKRTTGKKENDKKATVTNISTQAKKISERKKTTPVKETVKPAATAKAETVSKPKKAAAEKKTEEKVTDIQPKMSVAQRKAIVNLAQRRGITEEEFNSLVQESFESDFDLLTPSDASTLIRQLQQSA